MARPTLAGATAAALCLALLLSGAARAQETAPPPRPQADTAAESAASGLLTSAELEDLVAPVALFPDTLLIQILVGATQPFDVMKADRLLLENEGAPDDEVKGLIEAEAYDPSVAVLAEAFPDVLHRMAGHIDWTETVGEAMLAQSDDVLSAVQVMRDRAVDTGALASNAQQVVTQDPATNTVIVQPADPNVVYVPQYDARAVYDPGFTAADAVTTGLIAWGAATIIDEIFDDDDDWSGYWGCRDCAGWGGGPVIRDPDIDIDVDGNVVIGNRIDRDVVRQRIDAGDIEIGDRELRSRIEAGDIDRSELRDRIERGEVSVRDDDLRARLEQGGAEGWRPDAARRDDARARLEQGRETGALQRPGAEGPQLGGTDALRAKLSDRTGAADIARPGAAASRPSLDRAAVERGLSGEGAGLDRIRAGSPGARPVAKPAAKSRPALDRPAAASRPAVANRPAAASRPAVKKAAPKLAKKSSGPKAKAAAKRGKAGGARKVRR